jgi:hypothetical protein
MQYPHIIDIVVVGLDVIPHYVCRFSAILSFLTIVVVGLGVISHYVCCFGAIPSSCFMLWWLAQMQYLQ